MNSTHFAPPGIGFVRARSERVEGSSGQKEPLIPQSSRTRLPGGALAAYAERTIAAYRVHADKAILEWGRRRRPSRFLERFAGALPAGGRVLDYGCGTGEEMGWLRRHGFHVEGVDGTLEFVLAARRRCPGIRILHARFETVLLPPARYDGIWCNAALIHVPPQEMARQLKKLKGALKPAGWLGLTLAWGKAKRFLRRDWIPGRYLAAYTQAEADALLKGWRILWRKTAAKDGRSGRWIQLLASWDNGAL